MREGRTVLALALFIAASHACALPADERTEAGRSETPPRPVKLFYPLMEPSGRPVFEISPPRPDRMEDPENKVRLLGAARVFALLEADQAFRDLYRKVEREFASGSLPPGVTFANWQRGTQETKNEVRQKLVERLSELIDRHGLWNAVWSTPVEPALLESKLTTLRQALQLSAGEQSAGEKPLLEYCAGAVSNISVIQTHRLAARFAEAMQDPEFSRVYGDVGREFQKTLKASGWMEKTSLQEELDRIVKEKRLVQILEARPLRSQIPPP